MVTYQVCNKRIVRIQRSSAQPTIPNLLRAQLPLRHLDSLIPPWHGGSSPARDSVRGSFCSELSMVAELMCQHDLVCIWSRGREQACSQSQAPFSGVLDTICSLHPTMILDNSMIFEEKGRQAWRSPSPLGQGGAPASQSNCSQPVSSLQYLNALAEAWSEEQELDTTSHSMSLQESVGTPCVAY